jgi:hypothetical protein
VPGVSALESGLSFFSTKRPSRLENCVGALEPAGAPGLPRFPAELLAPPATAARKAASWGSTGAERVTPVVLQIARHSADPLFSMIYDNLSGKTMPPTESPAKFLARRHAFPYTLIVRGTRILRDLDPLGEFGTLRAFLQSPWTH